MDLEAKIKELHEEQSKLLTDLQTKYEDQLKNRVSKPDFEEYQKKIDTRWDEIGKELLKLKAPAAGPETKDQEVQKKKAIFFKALAGKPLTPEERKTLTLADDASAGYLAGPPEYALEIIKGVTEFSPVRQLANVKSTSRTAYAVPKRTGRMSATRIAETLTRTETGKLTYGLEEMSLPEAYALAKVSRPMLEDTLFNLETEINQDIVEQYQILEGREFLTGTGFAEPEGILTNAEVQAGAVETATANTIAGDDLIKLQYALKTDYARNASWLMHRATVREVRLLKETTTNAYIWQPGLQLGQPPLLLGCQVVECPDMPTGKLSNQFEIAFGDFKRGYLIVDRIGLEIQRLIELFSMENSVGFLARRRYNGQVVLAEAIKLLKIKSA